MGGERNRRGNKEAVGQDGIGKKEEGIEKLGRIKSRSRTARRSEKVVCEGCVRRWMEI
jgi:hypothetical protein